MAGGPHQWIHGLDLRDCPNRRPAPASKEPPMDYWKTCTDKTTNAHGTYTSLWNLFCNIFISSLLKSCSEGLWLEILLRIQKVALPHSIGRFKGKGSSDRQYWPGDPTCSQESSHKVHLTAILVYVYISISYSVHNS